MNTWRQKILTDHRRDTRKARRRRVVFISLGIFVVVAGLASFLLSKYFWVKHVEITGLSRAPETEVRAGIDQWLQAKRFLYPWRKPLWLLSAQDLTKEMKSLFPVIKEVVVSRAWPDSLKITFEEYDAWGVLCQGEPETCYWIDRAGVVFESAPAFSGLIVPKIRDQRGHGITPGSTQLSQNFMHLITYFNERARGDDTLQSLQFTIGEQDATVHATTRAGWDMLLLEDTNPETAYKNLRTTLDQEIKERVGELDYIDLRFGNRIFYKFRTR